MATLRALSFLLMSGAIAPVYLEAISDHAPNKNQTMIFALELLLLTEKLSILDYLEVS